MSILTGAASATLSVGGKRTAAGGGVGDGKRRRQQASSVDADGASCVGQQDLDATPPLPPAPPTFWQTVFARDKVTGAVCNSLAMVGTRGGALLEALRSTLLQLLEGNRARPRAKAAAGGGMGRGVLRSSSIEGQARKSSGAQCAAATASAATCVTDAEDLQGEQTLAVALQGQRAAMACVLCCWEGLDSEPSSTASLPGSSSEAAATSTAAVAAAAAATTAARNGISGVEPPSPLAALEQPMAMACVQAMRVAGTNNASPEQKVFSARLLRPVIVLVKRWPTLLPTILARIVAAAAAVGEDGGPLRSGGVGATGSRSIEPLVRCLQVVVRDPGLQGQLWRRHLRSLHEAVEALCGSLKDSLLRPVVEQLRADVGLLGGGLAMNKRNTRKFS